MLNIGFHHLILLLCFVLSGQVLGQSTYRIDTSSKIWVEGTSNLRDWTATVQSFEGTLEVNDQKSPTELQLTLDVASMDGGRGADMNEKIYKALKMEEHPQIIYQTTSIDPLTMIATGTLDLAGKQTILNVSGTLDLAAGKLTGTQMLKLSTFEIEPPSALFGQIVCRDDLIIHFELSLEKQ